MLSLITNAHYSHPADLSNIEMHGKRDSMASGDETYYFEKNMKVEGVNGSECRDIMNCWYGLPFNEII